jgi:aryl-alcohol dehydrogenase-like predicted oxidoreductase
MAAPEESSPLSRSEAELLDATLLPHLERHHLRLLAHGLRSFQAMAGRSQGGLPPAELLERWLEHQPGLADDPRFREAFRQQMIGLGQQLEQIAGSAGCTPLALSLEQLIHWARSQADERLGQQQQAHPGQHQ